MAKLEIIELEWIELFKHLRTDPEISEFVSAPFISVPPSGYGPIAVPSVLYVGKAVNGNGDCTDRDSFLRRPTLEHRRTSTTKFLEQVKTGKYKSPFWRFAFRLSDKDLQKLIWTNVCKLSDLRDNRVPSGKLLEAQRDLAVKTLREEIETYRPRLVVFVTGCFAEALVREVVYDLQDISWEKENVDLWWRRRTNSLPSMLWTRHPQGARRDFLDQCLNAVRKLWEEEDSRP